MFSNKRTSKFTKTYWDNIGAAVDLIKNADCIAIGAGAGFSAAGGINYGATELFKKWFPRYFERGFKSKRQIIHHLFSQ